VTYWSIGESNLKSRVASPLTRTMALEKIETFDGVIRCPQPNRDLYSFDSRLWLSPSSNDATPDGDATPLSGEQLLQQATRLRNTDKIYGLAVYTGNETKFGKVCHQSSFLSLPLSLSLLVCRSIHSLKLILTT
jgi:phospholipid-translocating ATPase